MLLPLCLLLAAAPPAEPAPTPAPALPTAQSVLEHVRDRVVQVRVKEKASQTKTAIGSGFFAGPPGTIITNYHVVSQLVLKPNRYVVDVVRGKTIVPATVVDVDVVHDLARLEVQGLTAEPLPVQSKPPPQGQSVYALGNPLDLGLTIVEGTFNGLRQEVFIDALNYSGSINPGMSGGPALDAQGEVVGVNVSTFGNGLAELVPASEVQALLDEKSERPKSLIERVGAELTDYQQRLTDDLLAHKPDRVALGGFTVPARWRPWIKCWSSFGKHSPEWRVDRTYQTCGVDSDGVVYVDDDQRAGIVEVSHRVLEAHGLSPMQFSTAAGRSFAADVDLDNTEGDSESVTNFRCTTRVVTVAGAPMRGAVCLRAQKRFKGLYDVVFRVQSQTESLRTMRSDLLLVGFQLDNAKRIAARFFENFQWTK